tara:strand:+ start:6020 stop:6361 length:342 start_codon:yes stop_codon:yes gene_type:complete
MTWKEIIKAPKKLTHSQSKHLDLNNDGKISREDFDLLNKKEKNLMKDIKKKILSAKTKQGGALAMKDLKDIASQKDLDKALAELIKERKMFHHTDGDFYTHEPSSKRRGPFTA